MQRELIMVLGSLITIAANLLQINIMFLLEFRRHEHGKFQVCEWW